MVVWSEVQTCILPLTVSCFSKIQIGFTVLVLAHLGSSGKRAVKRVCVCVCVCVCVRACVRARVRARVYRTWINGVVDTLPNWIFIIRSQCCPRELV